MATVTPTRNESAPDDRGLRSIKAAAEFLCVSKSKVYKMLNAGELPHVKLGKSCRVRWSDVLKLVERNTRNAG